MIKYLLSKHKYRTLVPRTNINGYEVELSKNYEGLLQATIYNSPITTSESYPSILFYNHCYPPVGYELFKYIKKNSRYIHRWNKNDIVNLIRNIQKSKDNYYTPTLKTLNSAISDADKKIRKIIINVTKSDPVDTNIVCDFDNIASFPKNNNTIIRYILSNVETRSITGWWALKNIWNRWNEKSSEVKTESAARIISLINTITTTARATRPIYISIEIIAEVVRYLNDLIINKETKKIFTTFSNGITKATETKTEPQLKTIFKKYGDNRLWVRAAAGYIEKGNVEPLPKELANLPPQIVNNKLLGMAKIELESALKKLGKIEEIDTTSGIVTYQNKRKMRIGKAIKKAIIKNKDVSPHILKHWESSDKLRKPIKLVFSRDPKDILAIAIGNQFETCLSPHHNHWEGPFASLIAGDIICLLINQTTKEKIGRIIIRKNKNGSYTPESDAYGLVKTHNWYHDKNKMIVTQIKKVLKDVGILGKYNPAAIAGFSDTKEENLSLIQQF